MLVLIIHLESAGHRQANAAALLAAFSDHQARILPAIKGAALSESAKAQWRAKRALSPTYPFVLNDGEIGCFLSHRAAWQALLESDHDSVLILEDDASVDRATLDQTLARITNQDFVQLQTRALKSGRAGLVAERPLPLRTTGQWLTRAAADRLLTLSATLDRPVDAFLQMTWYHKLTVASIYPSGVEEASPSITSSTIQQAKKKRLWGEVRRAFKRRAYRRKVRTLA